VVDELPRDQGAERAYRSEGEVEDTGGPEEHDHPYAGEGVDPSERQAGDEERLLVLPAGK